MDVVIFEIKEYMIIWRQLETREIDGMDVKIRGIVRCSGNETKSGDAYTMDVMFLSEESPFPTPSFDTTANKGMMYMPVADMMPFIDTLRNEKPIYGHLRGDRPEWTSVTTAQEPVGEGERE